MAEPFLVRNVRIGHPVTAGRLSAPQPANEQARVAVLDPDGDGFELICCVIMDDVH